MSAAMDGGHIAFKCSTMCSRPGCKFCDGGLFECTRCHGFEGTLPSECPGEKLDAFQTDAVYAGLLDFRGGQWVEAPSGSVSTHYDGRPGLPRVVAADARGVAGERP